jgi:hypothetical protein
MEPVRGPGRLANWAWLVFWGVVSSAWCVTAAGRLGATFDEPGYLARGLHFWRTGSHHPQLKLGTMPLPLDLDTLPLFVWERWHGVLLDIEGADQHRFLPWARAGTLLFWWLLLFYAKRAGESLAGAWGGRLAVALLAVEPVFLAHASLATTDVAVAACLLALTYHFAAGRAAGWVRGVGLPALWFGVALSCKASALALGPLCLVAVEVEQRMRKGCWHTEPGVRRFRWTVAQVLAGGLIIVFLYCGTDGKPLPSFVAWARQLPDGPGATATVWLAEHLCVFSNAGEAMVRQVAHNVRGHGVYLLGHADPRSLWYYFPVALSMKLSVPLLALPLALGVLRPRSLLNWACLAAAGLLVYSLNCRVQIGVRFMLPLAALAAVGLPAAVVATVRGLAPGWRRWAVGALAAGGLAWTAADTAFCWPDALRYTNLLWGGTERGYLCLSDSNYDWGQGLGELARWRCEQGLGELDVWYFGADAAVAGPGFHYVPLHQLPLHHVSDCRRWMTGRYLAVGVTLLYGSYGETKDPAAPTSQASLAAYLRACRPVGRTTTFFIYDLAGAIAGTDEPVGTAKPG